MSTLYYTDLSSSDTLQQLVVADFAKKELVT